MNLLKVESLSKFFVSNKEQVDHFCVFLFMLIILITLVEERTFITSAEGFCKETCQYLCLHH